jgi:hypothetical protein
VYNQVAFPNDRQQVQIAKLTYQADSIYNNQLPGDSSYENLEFED